MAMAPITDGRALVETEAEREARIRYERTVIARAEADIDAGSGIDDDVLEAWLAELEHDPDAPLPTRAQVTGSR